MDVSLDVDVTPEIILEGDWNAVVVATGDPGQGRD